MLRLRSIMLASAPSARPPRTAPADRHGGRRARIAILRVGKAVICSLSAAAVMAARMGELVMSAGAGAIAGFAGGDALL